MKLLILNYEYPPLGGGAGVCTKYQAEGLAKLSHQVCVITTWFDGEKEIEEHTNLKIIRLKCRRKKVFRSNPIEMLSWAITSFRYIRRNKLYADTDLILAHFAVPGGLVGLALRLFYKKPYYIISHGQDIPWFCPKELWYYHLIMYFPIRWICARAQKITALSQQRLKDLNRITFPRNRSKNHILPNGCDIDFFAPRLEMKDENKLRLLFIGRLSVQKDPFTFLRSAYILKEKNIPCEIEIIGDGPLRKRMEQYVVKNKLADILSFAGWISKETLREKYQQAQLLVVSSRDEGMSLAIMEALSCGMYVITTPVSGSENLIIENVNGNFFRPGKSEQIADCIQDYYKNKFTNHYTIDAKIVDSLRHQMSWDNYVRAYHQLIQE